MSQLIAIVYDTPELARQAAEKVREAARGQTIELRDLVVATRGADGRVALDQSVNLVAEAALGGAFWGSLLGLLFLAPLAGAVGGAALGAVSGYTTDFGLDETFMTDLAQKVSPGKAVVFILSDELVAEKIAPKLGEIKGDLLYSSLPDSVDAILKAALAHSGAQTPDVIAAVQKPAVAGSGNPAMPG